MAVKKGFSKVKAVKANARTRVGMPPPEQTLPDTKKKAERRKKKHKPTFVDLLTREE
jgi:hypothetical protein